MKGYQLKITIKGSKPAIWRRVIVPEKITFADLDHIIECIFGWTHSHLYEFQVKEEEISFMPDPEFDQEDAESELIDVWMRDGRKLLYIYDFGDWWEHTVLVEKTIDYDSRSAKVIKSKGPYMVEDCGGLWGFERGEAEPFDIDKANNELEKIRFPKRRNRKKSSVEESDFPFGGEYPERVRQELDESNLDESFAEMARKFMESIQDLLPQEEKYIGHKYSPVTITMMEVLESYSKDDLKNIARAHGFTRYSSFKKKELAEWLKNHLLDSIYLKHMLEQITQEELDVFEEAMEQNGIGVSSELIGHSLFLSSYGAYNEMEVLWIPVDVAEAYKKVCTPQMKRKMNRKFHLLTYCRGGIYLYGILPLEQLVKIYNHYEEDEIEREEAEVYIHQFMENGEDFVFVDDLIVDEELMDDNIYQIILTTQGDKPFYMPKDKEEFLDYGKLFCQEPDEYAREFFDFMMNKYKISEVTAHMAFYDIQEIFRSNGNIEDAMDILDHYLNWEDVKITGQKQKKMVAKYLKKIEIHTRLVRHRGYTEEEYRNLQGEKWSQPVRSVRDSVNKIIEFPGPRKVYPNDPCPCGSGKKYKYCCGKKQ